MRPRPCRGDASSPLRDPNDRRKAGRRTKRAGRPWWRRRGRLGDSRLDGGHIHQRERHLNGVSVTRGQLFHHVGKHTLRRQASITSFRCSGRSRAVLLMITVGRSLPAIRCPPQSRCIILLLVCDPPVLGKPCSTEFRVSPPPLLLGVPSFDFAQKAEQSRIVNQVEGENSAVLDSIRAGYLFSSKCPLTHFKPASSTFLLNSPSTW